MTPILYSSDEIDFLNNGLGQLVDLYDVDIHEQRNGLLNLTAYYPVNGQHYADISEGNIILAKPSPLDDNHAFRIVSVALDITGYAVMIEADSITYDLTNNLSKTIHMLGDGQAAMTAIQNSTLHPHIFTFYSDITHTSESQLRYVNPMEAIAGTQGSFLQIWGGELKRENRRVAMFNRRGRDNVATFRLGKNVAGLKYTVDVSNLTTEIVPTVTVNSTDASRTIEGATVQSSRMGNYPLVYSKMVDVSQDVKVDEGDTDDQIKAKINAFAANWFVKSANTGKDLPEVTIEVEVESLQDSADYADKFAKLETIGLTDTVTVYVPEFGVNVTAIVNELHYDPVAERVTKLSIGTAKTSWADSNKNALNDLQDKVTEVKEQASQAVVSANGKNSSYTGRDKPEHPQEGDLWFWNDGENSGSKQFVNGDWIELVDTQTNERIDNAVDSAVSEATSHADSLNAAQTSMASSVSASTAAALSVASAERNSLANMTNSMVADANAKSKSLADSAYAGAMAGVTSAGSLIAGVSSAVRAMGSAVSANSSAIAKAGNDLATGLSSAATYADSLTAKVGNSASAAVSSVSSDVNGIKAEFDSAKKTTHELSVATNSLSVGASGIAANLKEVTSTASGAMSAAASLAVDASGLHASYDKLSSQHAKDVETMNASYTAGISGIAASMATMQSTDRSLTSATNSLAITASGFTNSMAAVSSTASGAMSAAASLAANVSGVSASFNQLSNTVTRKVVSETVDLNNYVTTGKWFFSGRQTNAPQSGWAYVDVDAPSTVRLIQTWTHDQNASLQYSRYSTDNGKTWSSWVKAVQASDVTTAVNSASASYSAGINGLSADIKTVDTNAKGYATAAQNSAIATASQNATTITSAAISNFGSKVAETYATQATVNQTASQWAAAVTELQGDLSNSGVRYVRINGQGNNENNGTHFAEMQVINSRGVNVASGIVPTKTGSGTLQTPASLTDGNFDSYAWINNEPNNDSYIVLDLGSVMLDLQEIKLKMYRSPRLYYAVTVQVSSNGDNWKTVFHENVQATTDNSYNARVGISGVTVGRVSTLEVGLGGINAAVSDPNKGLSATWNLASNGQTLAVTANSNALTAISTANAVQTTLTDTANHLSNQQTLTAGQLTTEISNRQTGDQSVRTDMATLINQQITSVTNGYQSAITQTADGIIQQVGNLKIRYVRFASDGNTMNTGNHYQEFALYATNGANLLDGKVATTTGYTVPSSYPITSLTDGNKATTAQIGDGAMSEQGRWAFFDIGSLVNPDYVAITPYYQDGRRHQNVVVQVSADNQYWRTIYQGAIQTVAGDAARSTVRVPVNGSSFASFFGMFQDNFAFGIKDNTGNIISGINGDTSGVTITGKHITLNGDTTVTGTGWLNGAIIKNASIGGAQIANASITNANIFNLDVNKLSGDVANFIKTYWDGEYGSTSITSEGMTVSAGVTTTVFDENGMQFNKSSRSIGRIGVNDLYQDNSKKGLYFGLESTGDFMAWGAQNYAGNPYDTKLSWYRVGSVPSNLPGMIEGFNFQDNVMFNRPVEMRAGIKIQGTDDRLVTRATSLNGRNSPSFGTSSAGFAYVSDEVYLISNGTAYNLSKVIKALSGISTAAIPTGFASDGKAVGWYNVNFR